MVTAESTDGIDDLIHFPEGYTVHQTVQLIEIFFACSIIHFVAFGVGFISCLLERLTLMEYLYLPDNDYFKEPIDEKIRFYEDALATHVACWRSLLEDVEKNYKQFCLLATLSTVRMQAQSNRINYNYDPGGYGWKVSIELKEAYYADSLDGPDATTVQTVFSNHSPVCVSADGLPALDDRGGIHRYIEILEAMNCDPHEQEREYQREYARSLGWTGRVSKPQYIL